MHELKSLSFWPFHALTTGIAILIVFIARLIGYYADATVTDHAAIMLHSAILVIVGHTLMTAGALGAMRQLSNTAPLVVCAAVGCIAVSPIAAILSPLLSWSAGVGPTAIAEAASRDELMAAIGKRYLFVTAGYAVLGTLLWLTFDFEWWRERESSAPIAFVPAREPAPGESVAAATTPPFMRRVQPIKRGELWALSSELHYVRVYTSSGNDLVMMRISDAVDQCCGIKGARIHRSHWVAHDGVERVMASNGKLTVKLKNGTELPVSRSFHQVVRETFADLIR